MRISKALAAGTSALLAAALCTATAAPAAAEPRHRPSKPLADHVLFLALDGFDAEYVGDAPMPNLDKLLRRGGLATSTGVMTSITNPSWSSVATGAWPERHRNTAYWYDAESGTARGQQREMAVPTIGQAVREQGGTILSAQWFTLQNYGTAYGDPEGIYTQPGGACPRRVDDAVAVLEGRPVDSGGTAVTAPKIPDLIAVYCDTLDSIGHDGGAEDPRIPEALRMIDEQIGRLVEAVQEAGIYGRTTFVITGDHGMTTFTGGLNTEVVEAVAEAGYKLEYLGSGQRPAPDTDAVMVVGGVGSLHLVGDAAGSRRAERRIAAALRDVPHVRAVYDERDQRRMRMSPNHGELVVEPEPGWSLGAAPASPKGSHGSTGDLRVPLVIAGAGVRPHAAAWRPRHVDVAPTMAALLGIRPPSGVQGRVLGEVLQRRH
ncbi:alkaline phosphatase family protein [Actinomadura sp. WMMB 499]|uniref:alkaline phosphatase family protein n=1 Tax=Actinomadura sp. WMMB 499 TaxID=1219491 RepID=UPI00159D133C|nr:alkaline phosphatase family protein [Actinomadura sp. WMMB 499]